MLLKIESFTETELCSDVLQSLLFCHSTTAGMGKVRPEVACGPQGHLVRPTTYVMNTIKMRPANIFLIFSKQ